MDALPGGARSSAHSLARSQWLIGRMEVDMQPWRMGLLAVLMVVATGVGTRADDALVGAAAQRTVLLDFIAESSLAERGYARARIVHLLDAAGGAALERVFSERVKQEALNHSVLDDVLHHLNKAVVDRRYRDALKKHKDAPDRLVLPGLVADRKARRIVVYAQATGLTAKGEPPEFFIIAENSGHDYEALSVAFVKPSDVHRALRFIGMEPGRRVDPDRLQFWPKGERALLTFTARLTDKETVGPVRMERLFVDRKTGKPLDGAGLVFIGSAFVPSPTDPDETVYAADVFGPNAIAANYNEPSAVFDVPRQAPQKEIYGQIGVNPDTVFPPLALLEIVIEPEYKDGKKRVVDLDLSVALAPGRQGAELGDMALTLKNAQGETLDRNASVSNVLERFATLVEDGHDPFVTVRFDDALPLESVRRICVILAALDTEKGIRLEPPPPDQLYYRAFTPDPAFKDRARRFAQPWELRLTRGADGVTGVLTRLTQSWQEKRTEPDIVAEDFPVASGEALRAKLDELGPGLKVVLVFAAPDIVHGGLMAFIEPIRSTHPLIHVFVEGLIRGTIPREKGDDALDVISVQGSDR